MIRMHSLGFFEDISKLLLQLEICQLIFIDIFDLYWQGQSEICNNIEYYFLKLKTA